MLFIGHTYLPHLLLSTGITVHAHNKDQEFYTICSCRVWGVHSLESFEEATTNRYESLLFTRNEFSPYPSISTCQHQEYQEYVLLQLLTDSHKQAAATKTYIYCGCHLPPLINLSSLLLNSHIANGSC